LSTIFIGTAASAGRGVSLSGAKARLTSTCGSTVPGVTAVRADEVINTKQRSKQRWKGIGGGRAKRGYCRKPPQKQSGRRKHTEASIGEAVPVDGAARLHHGKSMTLISGAAVAEKVLEECRRDIAELAARGRKPGLAVVLVGDDPASRAYVRSKDKKCRDLGLHSVKLELPATTTQDELLAHVRALNNDPAIHGILVQSPPPKHIDEAAIVRAIDPAKDVDGFHPVNVAKLALEDPTGFVPCTPLGCQRLLIDAGIETSGAHAVVVGRSMIVGKPMALLLMAKGKGGDATVTVTHSRTRDLAAITRSADIIIAAIGRPHFIKAEHVKEGAVVIDVGINRVDDSTSEKGYKLVGDVAFDEVAPKCRAITPVPGGVGPMTIAMLMSNTIKACKQAA
jgi:methylenetetrahydrofolate dehydrogenase (NADP+)/methenyltetrahydrofolate cyclohydrolase